VKYLNLGCGEHYSSLDMWTNVDFVSSGLGVISHNLLKGIPFEPNSFDVVYHSHVLEHFKKQDGEVFIRECYRTLKTDGTLRIAVPDLEQISRNYLECLEQAMKSGEAADSKKYDWMMIEMYDQTVREKSGGQMLDFLQTDNILAEDFIMSRMGVAYETMKISIQQHNEIVAAASLKFAFKKLVKGLLNAFPFFRYYMLGKFRSEGEIHQWMYDRYSLTSLLKKVGFREISTTSAFESRIPGWANYGLDGVNNVVRKPDSLFLEATK